MSLRDVAFRHSLSCFTVFLCLSVCLGCCFVVFALAQGYVGYVLGASFGRRRCWSATMRDDMG
jgi:hypothetical protein